ncbi:hypothetical protein BBJ28_00001852 [Nothophytophthora sp. Chile5]|nr:hypothetical protein BBJ28_00001852 [Nothophytophthora sp. Chile5]
MLFILGCVGFNTLQASTYTLESRTSSGCLCFLGVCFGLLLAFGESTWELFFFFFGFMRYRFGRAFVFAVSGIMTALLGKTRDDQCNCEDNVMLIVEGVACIAMAILQMLAIFVFGNNSAPRRDKDQEPSTAATRPTSLPVTAPRSAPLPRETPSFHAVVQPVQQAPTSLPPMKTPPPARAPGDSNLPDWMHTP